MGGDFPRDDCGQELFRWPCAPGRPGKHPPVRLRLSLCHLCAAFPRQSACFGNRPGQARIPRAGSRPVFAWQPRQRRPAWQDLAPQKRGGRVSRQHFPHQPPKAQKTGSETGNLFDFVWSCIKKAADAAKTGKHLARKGLCIPAQNGQAQKQFHDFLVAKGQGICLELFSQAFAMSRRGRNVPGSGWHKISSLAILARGDLQKSQVSLLGGIEKTVRGKIRNIPDLSAFARLYARDFL